MSPQTSKWVRVVRGLIVLLAIYYLARWVTQADPRGPFARWSQLAPPTTQHNERPPTDAARTQAPRRINGRVRAEGRPVPGARVRLEADEFVTETSADSDGRFAFESLQANQATVSAVADSYAPVVRTVAFDEVTQVADIVLELRNCEATLSGRILDSAGGPIEHARLHLRGATGGESDASGHYRLCLMAGEHQLLAEAKGYGSRSVTVALLGPTERDITLVPAAFIKGVVLSGDSAQVVPFARVTAISPHRSNDMPAPVVTRCDASGEFMLSVAPAEFLLEASAEHGASTEHPTHATASMGVENEHVVLRLGVRPRATITGVVKDDQHPVANVQVMALSKVVSVRAVAKTNAEGRFTLESVTPGPTIFMVDSHEVVSPLELTVEPRRNEVAIDVAHRGAVRGLVTEQGVPVPDAQVWFDARSGSGLTTTDASGRFTTPGLASGRYELVALSPKGHAFGKASVSVDRADVEANIELAFAGEITGVVMNEGVPLRDVSVTFTHENRPDIGQAVTDEQGRFRCAQMCGEGVYRATVRNRAGQVLAPASGQTVRVELPRANSRVSGVVLAVDAHEVVLSGRVVASSGEPIADAVVRMPSSRAAYFKDAEATTTTDPIGQFHLRVVGKGPWGLVARAPDGAVGELPNVLDANTLVTITLRPTAGISGHLMGFANEPVVFATNERNEFSRATVQGSTFHVQVPPGAYVVTAMTMAEGDTQRVSVEPGSAAEVTLTSHGSGRIRGVVIEHQTGRPIEGLPCRAVARDGDTPGVTNWSLEACPRSNRRGEFEIDPAPAGEVLVQCIGMPSEYSLASTPTTITPGATATVTLEAVREEALPTAGVGLVCAQGTTGLRVMRVLGGSSAAASGVAPGEFVVAVDGHDVSRLAPEAFDALLSDHVVGSSIELTTQRGQQAITRRLVVEPL